MLGIVILSSNAGAQVDREVFDSRKVCKIDVPLAWRLSKDAYKYPEGVSSGAASRTDKSMLLLFAFDRTSLDKDISSEKFLQFQADKLAEGSKGLAKGEVKDGKINGKPSKYMRALLKTTNVDLYVYWMVIEGKNRLYLIQGSCHAKNQAQRETEILTAMSSFREIKA